MMMKESRTGEFADQTQKGWHSTATIDQTLQQRSYDGDQMLASYCHAGIANTAIDQILRQRFYGGNHQKPAASAATRPIQWPPKRPTCGQFDNQFNLST